MHIEDFSARGASVKGLLEAFAAGAPMHAAVLLGAPGIGKRTLAHLLAQSLFCTGPAPKPCGVCPGCRRYLVGSHPDAYRITEQKRIGVDEIRALLTALSSTAYEGGWRTVVMESAGAMTPQAQNALLKTLEEPPPRTVFLLTASSASQLLPTIISRCVLVHMQPYTQAEIAAILQGRGIDAARAQTLAALAQGSVGLALAMQEDEGFWTLREGLYATLDGIRGPADVLAAVNRFRDQRADAVRACDLLENALHGALVASLGGEEAEPGWPAKLAEMPAEPLTTLLERVQAMRRMLASNVSWQAVWERFLLEYTEELTTWQRS